MTQASIRVRGAAWTLLLLAALGSVGVGQDLDKRCREIESATAAAQKSRASYSTIILMSDKFAFYDGVWKKVRQAAALNKVADGLGAIIQNLDKQVLDLPEIGGRPQATEKELLAFQGRLSKLLDEVMNEVTDFDPGSDRDRTHRRRIEKYDEQIEELRDEYADLKCGFLKKDPREPLYPNIAGAWESDYKGTWNPTSITQSGKTLTFTNEFRDSSPGEFVSESGLIATKWERGLRATISSDNRTIKWANGTTWRRRQ